MALQPAYQCNRTFPILMSREVFALPEHDALPSRTYSASL